MSAIEELEAALWKVQTELLELRKMEKAIIASLEYIKSVTIPVIVEEEKEEPKPDHYPGNKGTNSPIAQAIFNILSVYGPTRTKIVLEQVRAVPGLGNLGKGSVSNSLSTCKWFDKAREKFHWKLSPTGLMEKDRRQKEIDQANARHAIHDPILPRERK